MNRYQILINTSPNWNIVFDRTCEWHDVLNALSHLQASLAYSPCTINWMIKCPDWSAPVDVCEVGVFDRRGDWEKLPDEFTFSDLVDSSRLSLVGISQRFGIPYRTVQDWNAGKRKPPEYVLKMISTALNMYTHF